ncbi:DUF3426 domain-containing protein [Porphyrobacter sp. GA68]|uniref:DUF3426 domain-containing protein n=1 Tax=Porphyrobacter sp. GA68 TaxID=2883480 RepID=UPI001D189859|nr:DUF3426 domain-containing protein [Porphyrobacter sp. GA68]
MIIACPACGTKYVVPDDALGVEGRTVRCAKCKHNWFQDGPRIEPPANLPPEDFAEPGIGGTPATREEATAPGAASGAKPPAMPADEERPGADRPLPDALVTPPPFYRAADAIPSERRPNRDAEDEVAGQRSSFAFEPPFASRLNRGRLLTIGAAGFAAIALLTIAVLQIWGLPSWLSGSDPLFAGEEPGLTMSFPDDRQQIRTTDGGEYLVISGTISNTSSETRPVPSILVVLRDARDRVVFSQELASPKPRLAPGETQPIDAAIADIPQSATDAEFGWAPR